MSFHSRLPQPGSHWFQERQKLRKKTHPSGEEVRTVGARESKAQERRGADRAKSIPSTPKLVATQLLSIAPAQRCLRATPPLRAPGGLLVSRQPLTRGANQRAAFARPPPLAPGARIPRGRGRRAPPWLPREAGRGAGAGAGSRGGVVRPVKIGGGGGGTAHSRQLSVRRSHRAAPAGGCPRQPPASVASSSSAQVSPCSPPPQV